jgi:protein involved in polysaccharide export with SLBB domain
LFGAFSASQIEKAKQMVAKNPSLLNTPQAKKMMQQHQKDLVAKGSYSDTKQKVEPVENDIEFKQKQENRYSEDKLKFQQQDIQLDKNTKPVEKNTLIRLSPQNYKSNDEELYRIKSAHNTREHKELERFSKEFFRNKNKILQKNINAPKDYIINRGDTITFWIYGATNQEHELIVNSQGNINIPEIGPVRVAGERYSEVKELLTNYLSSSYKNSDVVVDLNSYSTAQVTLTGFVNTPGIFNTTSVSSVKDILIEAHGVSEVGSVRNIKVKRDGRTIATIDYYHLLSLGLDHGDIVLQPNDTIYVPRAYGLIRLEGAVNKEAIYEIERGESLSHILKIAGGIQSKADGMKIYIKRYDHNRQIKYHKISIKDAARFILRDGDEVYVGSMDRSNERYIEIIGNVLSEGKREINSDSIQLSQLLRKEIRNGKLNTLFLENTQLDYAIVKRVNENLQPVMYNINLENILNGSDDFTLYNRDQLYIFNKLDIAINPYVTIKQATTQTDALKNEKEEKALLEKQKREQEGDTSQLSKLNLPKEEKKEKRTILMNEGKYLFTEGMTLKDIINLAGVKSPFDKQKVKVISYDKDNKTTQVNIVDFSQNPEYPLKEFDTVYLFDVFETTPVPKAYISGEVVHPGSYEVSDNMMLSDFINSAGGLSDKAYPKECEIIRYYVENGERKKKILNIDMQNASVCEIYPYDEINIKKIPYWNDRRTVFISGEVKFPGSYTISSGEKLSSVIKRAGGYTDDAFLYGAHFTRVKIAKMQKESLRRELSKLKEQVILVGLQSAGSKSMNPISISEGIAAVESLIKEAELLEPKGRVTINLENDLDSFSNCSSDLTLQDGDKLHIPSINDTVVVNGEVMNPTAMAYSGDNIKDYISRSGGLTEIADTDHIYVIHANGEARKATLGSYLFSSNKVSVKKGDVIIVPKKLMFERGIDIMSNVADIFYKLSLTVAAMHTVGAL